MKKHSMLRIVLAILLLVSLVLPASAGSAEIADYYAIGLKVTAVLDEMVQSKDFMKLLLSNQEALDLAETAFNTGDHDKPTAVYSLKQTDPLAWMRSKMSEEEKAQLDALSPVLQEQILNRLKTMSSLVSQINAKKSVEFLAASSALQALVEVPGLEAEERVCYLYVFEKSAPVLVSYGRHQAVGMFLALDSADMASAETLRAFLEPYGVEVTPVAATNAGTETGGLFEQIKGQEFIFASGVGAWYTALVVREDGSFTGDYHDSEMGDAAETYPDGTVYGCLFHGQLSDPVRVDEYTWTAGITVEKDEGQAAEAIEDGIRYVTAEPYGLEKAGTVTIYVPGTPVESLPEELLFWTHLQETDPDAKVLPFHVIWSEADQAGFAGSV